MPTYRVTLCGRDYLLSWAGLLGFLRRLHRAGFARETIRHVVRVKRESTADSGGRNNEESQM